MAACKYPKSIHSSTGSDDATVRLVKFTDIDTAATNAHVSLVHRNGPDPRSPAGVTLGVTAIFELANSLQK
jgi:hypothetical protein